MSNGKLFSPEYQPSPENKKRGWLIRSLKRDLLKAGSFIRLIQNTNKVNLSQQIEFNLKPNRV
jgi:hypothetical protein